MCALCDAHVSRVVCVPVLAQNLVRNENFQAVVAALNDEKVELLETHVQPALAKLAQLDSEANGS
jgi:hypothetical protein